MRRLGSSLLSVGWFAASLANAHVVLDQTSAPAGSSYRAVFKVGHGCDGFPTTGIKVRMPPGVTGAKPMAKVGWRLDVKSEKLAKPMAMHGRTMETDVAEIEWSAAAPEAAVLDAYYDEFIVRATLPPMPGVVWFKVTQTCDDHGHVIRKEWSQTPESGSSIKGLALPAAPLEVTAPMEMGHVHP